MASAAVTPSDAAPTDAAMIATAWLGVRPTRLDRLGVGGFSGVPLVRVGRTGGCDLVLKRVAHDAASARHPAWVHVLVHRARACGVSEIPAPLCTAAGGTLVADTGGGVWELVPFVAGRAVERPDAVQVEHAMDVLARVHEAWAADAGDVTAAERWTGSTVGFPPAVVRRIDRARELVRRPWAARRRDAACVPAADDGLVMDVISAWDRAIAIEHAIGGTAVVHRIAALTPAPRALQPVLRDVWFDHVLYHVGDESDRLVSAVIDIHGTGVDTPATDIARLVGSWWTPTLGVGLEAWLERAVERYACRRSVGVDDHALVVWLHAGGVVCALDNWFRWVVEERRGFADASRVTARIDRLLDALPAALAWLADHPGIRV